MGFDRNFELFTVDVTAANDISPLNDPVQLDAEYLLVINIDSWIRFV